MYHLASFLKLLLSDDESGCLMMEKAPSSTSQWNVQFSFVSLTPSIHFEKVGDHYKRLFLLTQMLDKCHSVILASGTLSPLTLIKTQLFPKKEHSERLSELSCQHIVPKERVLAMQVIQGPSGKRFDFRFECRSQKEMLNEVRCVVQRETSKFIDRTSYFGFLQRHSRRICHFCSFLFLSERPRRSFKREWETRRNDEKKSRFL